jgi:predicted metal-dependent hydrolase
MTTARQMASLTFGGTRIVYQIQRSQRRRTLAITVNPDATVVVMAPKGERAVRIAAEMQRKAAWIVKQQDWIHRHHPKRPRQFVSGETFLYLGRQYHLRIAREAKANRSTILQSRGSFWIQLPSASTADDGVPATRRLLVRWYRQHAQEYLNVCATDLARKLGVMFASVRPLDMKTRWGSGGPNGHLRFNWRIIMAPRRLVEYVVAHELCHIVHNQHSPEFWRLLGRILPDYEQLRQQLAEFGPSYDF